MSRDLSLNKIAPHIPSSSVQGVNRTNPIPEFSPYMVEADKKFSENEEHNNKKHSEESSDTDELNFKDRYPEIFKLIEIPDFSELFQLARGKEGGQLMAIVKTIRTQRGVSTLIPISESQKLSSKETQTYLHTIDWFSTEKGGQFAGRM